MLIASNYPPLKKVACRDGLRVIRPTEHYDASSARTSNVRPVHGVIQGDLEKRGTVWYVPVLRDDTQSVEWIALSRLKVNNAA